MKICVKSLAAVALAVHFVALSSAAIAKQLLSQKIATSYDIYVGEVRFLHAQVQTMLDAQGYRMTTQAQTVGTWAALLPWAATTTSHGKLFASRAQPQHYATTVSWRQQPKTITMDFADNGDVTYMKESAVRPKQSERLDRSVTAKTLDPLSGVLQMLTQVSTQENCQAQTTVLDGKQRIEVKVTDQGLVTLHANEKNSYAGAARQCLMTFKSEAGKKSLGQTNVNDNLGFWHGSGERPPVTVWLARLRPDLPLVPVRAATTCPLGPVMAQLASWSNGDQPGAPELFARTESKPR